ncbi:SRPBCC family protein [Aliikangiella marina]|uniref:SRPBCC family protein n=1 Tax=Aliikangiella marina TaxID=1712262 RepID=A0A545T4N9_9GAMM|nr:SRPBCC family protein [Aliikangiella marina]TQV72184.1 SRPBCC family protein [Aliikangiella marina]
MKLFLKIFGVLLALFIIVGLVLDNSVDVRRQVVIEAAPQAIHPYLSDLKQWPKWTPWAELDPSMKTTIGNISAGVGASQSWAGQSGAGALTITQSSLEEGVIYSMNFEGDSTVYTSGLTYQWDGKATTVTWFMKGKMEPIIIGNYFAQLMDKFVGQSYEDGLNKLKELVESTV